MTAKRTFALLAMLTALGGVGPSQAAASSRNPPECLFTDSCVWLPDFHIGLSGTRNRALGLLRIRQSK